MELLEPSFFKTGVTRRVSTGVKKATGGSASGRWGAWGPTWNDGETLYSETGLSYFFPFFLA